MFSPNAFITTQPGGPGGPSFTTDISGGFLFDAATNTAEGFDVTLSGAVSGTFTTGDAVLDNEISVFVAPGEAFDIPFVDPLSSGGVDNLSPLPGIPGSAGGSAIAPSPIIQYTFSPNAFITTQPGGPGGPSFTTDISGGFLFDAATNTAEGFDVTLSGAVSGTFTTGDAVLDNEISVFVAPGEAFDIPFVNALSLDTADNLSPLPGIPGSAGGSADPSNPVPEPASLVLLASGVAGVFGTGMIARLRRRLRR